MAENTLDTSLYKQLNWMSFEGMSKLSNSVKADNRTMIGAGTPYLDLYAGRGYRYDRMQDLVNGDKKYMIMIMDRDKTPAPKKTESTDIISASGSYIDDHGLYSNGQVVYTCLLTPRYGDSYGIDACYDMLLKYLSSLEAIQGYGVLHDSYEDRWCYAAFSGASDIQKYGNSISFKLSFTTKPQWYSNSWANYFEDPTSRIEIDDFSQYTGRSDSGAASIDKMYKINSDCPQDCPPLLLIKCDSSASSWSLTFPASTSLVSDTDITLSFRYASTWYVDCIAQGIVSSYTADTLYYLSQNKQGLLYESTPSEYPLKTVPYRYPVIRRGVNYVYGSGIKSLTIYPMHWQL